MILVTGGAGYIGSHAVLELLQAGHEVLVLDNLCNSSLALDRVEQLAGRPLHFVKGDVRNRSLLKALFAAYPITAVMHFAGLKAVGESVREPLRYYETNVGGSIALCQAMAEAGVFSWCSALGHRLWRVAGDAHHRGSSHWRADQPTASQTDGRERAQGPGWTPTRAGPSRCCATSTLSALMVGADRRRPQRRAEQPAAVHAAGGGGSAKQLSVYGDDYPTPDGTGIRDYIHVVDLVKGHLKALERLNLVHGAQVWNLGAGKGHSVREMITAFEEVTGRPLPHVIKPRRAGDIAQCWSDRAGRARAWAGAPKRT